jgi:hypothetical protein
MKERYQKAIKLRERGKTFREIGKELSVGEHRAHQIYHNAKILERSEKLLPKWAHRLKPKYANELIAAGYTSKKQVIKGLESGAIGLIPGSSKGVIFGIGRAAIGEISIWAGISTPEQEAINNAIIFLESHGYVVTKA